MSALHIENMYRITVQQYHQMILAGALNKYDKCELLNGYLTKKKTKTPPVAGTMSLVHDVLFRTLDDTHYMVRQGGPITLLDSEPEPDVAVVIENEEWYCERHPIQNEVVLVVEVSEASLQIDRTTKLEIYAKAGIPQYWIVNLIEKCVEVYTLPSTELHHPTYRRKRIVLRPECIPLELPCGNQISVPVQKFLILPGS
jgi:Uma2 family endonuclease